MCMYALIKIVLDWSLSTYTYKWINLRTDIKFISENLATTYRLAALSVLLVAGCTTNGGYTPLDQINYKTIRNEGVGVDGYSVTVPSGFSIFFPDLADPDSTTLNYFQQRMVENYDYKTKSLKAQGKYLLEGKVPDCIILFTAMPKRIGKPWSMMLSMEKNAVLKHELRRRSAFIDGKDAVTELVTINGQRGWYISDVIKNTFNKSGEPLARETYKIAGKFQEEYFFNAYGTLENREYLKVKTRMMVESLEIH